MNKRPPGRLAEGYWEMPGGRIEPGETPKQCAIRELQEEFGVTPIDPELIEEVHYSYPEADVELHVFRAKKWEGKLEPKEGQEYDFFFEGDIPSPVIEATIPILPKMYR